MHTHTQMALHAYTHTDVSIRCVGVLQGDLRRALLGRSSLIARLTEAQIDKLILTSQIADGALWEADHIMPVCEGGGQ